MTTHAEPSDLLNVTRMAEEIRDLSKSMSALISHPPNFWDILEYGRHSYETRYSKMLRWLLDPTENHGLGDLVARRLAEHCNLAWHVDQDSRDRTVVATEDHDIDVLYSNPAANLCIVIENKTGSDVHNAGTSDESQLKKYYDDVEGRPGLKGTTKAYIFLAPEDDDPYPDLVDAGLGWYDAWTVMAYSALEPILGEACAELRISDEADAPHALKIIEDFRYDQRRKFSTEHRDEISRVLFGTANADPSKQAGVLVREMIAGLLAYDLVDGAEIRGSGGAYQQALRELSKQERESFRQALQQDHLDQKNVRDVLKWMWEYKPRVYRQDHTPNAKVSGLVTDLVRHFAKVDDPRGSTSYEVRQGLPVGWRIRRTRGKGQGMYMTSPGGEVEFYISGDKAGRFPNDGFGYNTDPKDHKAGRAVKGVLDNRQLNHVDHWLDHFGDLTACIVAGIEQTMKKLSAAKPVSRDEGQER